jgi:hypothetical protein
MSGSEHPPEAGAITAASADSTAERDGRVDPERRRSAAERALAALRERGNPFRQQFARNADDLACTRYHVDDLFARERGIIRGLIEAFRGDPNRPTAVLPILGSRGAGKTHLLHCLKHQPGQATQLYVTPGTFRIDRAAPDTGFLEYVLFQLINVLLAGGEQRGVRPLVYVGEVLTRRLLAEALEPADDVTRLSLAPVGGVSGFFRKLGLGRQEGILQVDAFARSLDAPDRSCRELALECGLAIEPLCRLADRHLDATEPRDLGGDYRRRVLGGLVRATLTDDPTALADFLTDGFVEPEFAARPTRTSLTLTLLQTLTRLIVGAGIPTIVAFDQLEELLYGQAEEEIRRSADAFFGGIVQLMSQTPGLCVLLFVEEGLWNRLVPSLSPHILDRLHEPIAAPDGGLIRDTRLHSPTAAELTKVVACRVRRTLHDLVDVDLLPESFPFADDFLARLARRETVLRLMLQACCTRLDEMLDRGESAPLERDPGSAPSKLPSEPVPVVSDESMPMVTAGAGERSEVDLLELWRQEVRASERKLKPVGAMAGATAELHAGLVRWLELNRDSGAAAVDRTLAGVRDPGTIGDHPGYGSVVTLEWRGRTAARTVAVGLWLGRGVGKPRDLEVKLKVFEHPGADRLVLLRPEDDVRLSGRTQTVWGDALAGGRNVELEPVGLDRLSRLHALPRWWQQATEAMGGGAPPPEVVAAVLAETRPLLERLAWPGSDFLRSAA